MQCQVTRVRKKGERLQRGHLFLFISSCPRRVIFNRVELSGILCRTPPATDAKHGFSGALRHSITQRRREGEREKVLLFRFLPWRIQLVRLATA